MQFFNLLRIKRVDLLKKLNRKGCLFIRHGGNHEWYQNPESKMCQPIPRHKEINELVAKKHNKKTELTRQIHGTACRRP